MDRIIQDLPNTTVAIICNIASIDEHRKEYALNLQEVAFGKVDDYGIFNVEDNGEKITSIDDFDETKYDKDNRYYIYPIQLEELKEKYKDKTTSTELAIAYYKEVREDIILLYKDKSNENIILPVSKKDTKKKRVISSEKIITKKEQASINSDLANIKRRELADYLKERIFDNDSIMEDIATMIIANFRTTNPNLMKNLLAVGPTGSGKTKTFRLIAEFANIPIIEFDCNQLTAEGYVGKGVDDIFKNIYAKTNGDIKSAERSILYLDEIDKLASRGNEVTDVSVQQGLLKVLEGATYTFEGKKGGSPIQLNTSFITKIGSGAFMDLFDKRKQKHTLGFESDADKEKKEKIEDKILTDSDIIEYGFLPEFVGRFPLIYTYKPLDEEGLKRVLTESKISPLLQIKERLNEEFGCEIEYDDAFLYEIIAAALKTEAGGRSLNKIISQSFIKLEGAMFDEVDLGHTIPKKLTLDKKMITDPTKFKL